VKSSKSLLKEGLGTGKGGAIDWRFDSIAFFRRQISLAPEGFARISCKAFGTLPCSAMVKASCQKFVGRRESKFKLVNGAESCFKRYLIFE